MPNTTTPTSALRALGVGTDTYGPTVNTGSSPRYVEVLGRALAEELRESNAETLVIWSTPDEAVLAHAVALPLGATVRSASEVEGILTLDEPIAPGQRAALLATEWEGRWLAKLRQLVLGSGGELVAAAAVVGSEALGAVTGLVTAALVPEHEAKELLR